MHYLLKKVACLISIVGAKTYSTLQDLCKPDRPNTKTFQELSTILQQHFQPKQLEVAEAFKFHRCVQSDSESVWNRNTLNIKSNFPYIVAHNFSNNVVYWLNNVLETLLWFIFSSCWTRFCRFNCKQWTNFLIHVVIKSNKTVEEGKHIYT